MGLTELSRSIEGRVAVVTGAGSGMGAATAKLLASEGAHVAACDVTEAVDDVVAEITAAGATAIAYRCDVADPAAIESLVEAVRSDLGPIDILVNNAGISVPVAFDDAAYEDAWARTLDVNLHAHMRLIRACLKDLCRDGEGRIVNISSTEGLGGSANTSPYTASKHGVVGLTKSLAVELGKTGVTVNAVCPGPINTGMTDPIPDDAKAVFARRQTALRRYGEPEEVAHVTLSLVLPAASYITGTAIPVDGGMRARNN